MIFLSNYGVQLQTGPSIAVGYTPVNLYIRTS